MPYTIPRKKKPHTNLPDEIYPAPNIDRTNNIIIGIAVGVMITACAVIYVVTEVISELFI